MTYKQALYEDALNTVTCFDDRTLNIATDIQTSILFRCLVDAFMPDDGTLTIQDTEQLVAKALRTERSRRLQQPQEAMP